MRILIAMIIKEIQQLVADKFYVRFLLIAPVLQLIVLGYSLSFETKQVKTVICDMDSSSLSREFIAKVSQNEGFQIRGYVHDYRELARLVHTWDASVGLYIPPGFSKDSESGGGVILTLLDAVDGNKALTAYGYLEQIAARMGSGVQAGKSTAVPVFPHHYLFNRELKSEAYMVPGIVVLIITIITLLIGSMSLVKEKESGTLEQLSVTPVARWQLILGKLLPFLLYACLESVLVLKVGELVFRLRMAGSLLYLYGAVMLYLFTTLGLGLFISTLVGTQQQALFLAWFFMIFLILLSGFLIPLQNMPLWLQYLTLLNPLRYMMTIVREIYLKGTPLALLADQLIPMGLLGLAIFLLSVMRFQKKSG